MPEEDKYLKTKGDLAGWLLPLMIVQIIAAFNPPKQGFAAVIVIASLLWLGWYFVWSFAKESDAERTAKKRAFAYFLLGIMGMAFVSAIANSVFAYVIASMAGIVWDVSFIIWGFSKEKV